MAEAIIEFTKIEAKDYKFGDGKSSDIYVKLSAGSSYGGSVVTYVKKKASGPVTWEEKQRLPVGGDDLVVTLHDQNFVQKDELLGKIVIPIASVHGKGKVDKWFDVPEGGQVRLVMIMV